MAVGGNPRDGATDQPPAAMPAAHDWIHHTALQTYAGDATAEAMIDSLGLRPGDRVLDLGCGGGGWAALLAERVGPTGHVDALDPNPEALALAQTLLAERRPALVGRVHFAPGRSEAIPAADATYDLVWLSLVLHHHPEADQPAALREIRRVLRPGGRVAIRDGDSAAIEPRLPLPPDLRVRVAEALADAETNAPLSDAHHPHEHGHGHGPEHGHGHHHGPMSSGQPGQAGDATAPGQRAHGHGPNDLTIGRHLPARLAAAGFADWSVQMWGRVYRQPLEPMALRSLRGLLVEGWRGARVGARLSAAEQQRAADLVTAGAPGSWLDDPTFHFFVPEIIYTARRP